MADEEIKNPDIEEGEGNFDVEPPIRFLNRSKILNGFIVVAIGAFLLAIIALVAYRIGFFDDYIKAQFTAKMSDIGIAFKAKKFNVTVIPLKLTLVDAQFRDKLTGGDLFSIEGADLDLSVQNLIGWQRSSDIIIDKTKINGAQVWVKFDENGRSNFANLKLIEDEKGSSVNFRYDTGSLEIDDSVVHLGDLSRKISANANDISFLLYPEGGSGDSKRYGFSLISNGSDFSYEERKIEDISLDAKGIADGEGAEFTRLDVKTPIGYSYLTGRLTDWAAPKYDFDIESSVDLTRAADILSPGSALTGETSFIGKLSGSGENYNITGKAASQSLRAGGVLLKAVKIDATVAGTNANYTADGEAIAEMLTFDDFRVDMIRMMGNVRGTGTDFRWLGELQAAAARSSSLSLGGLYLKDARLEHRDREILAGAGSGRAQKFSIGDTEFAELQARNLKFSLNGGNLDISASNANSRSFTTKDYSLNGITGNNVAVKRRNGVTSVNIDNVRSEKAEVRGNKAANVSADEFHFTDRARSTTVTAKNLKAGTLDMNVARVDGLESPDVELENTAAGLVVYSDKLRVARIDTDGATLGSLNIGGVRLTIKQGRVEARSNDVDAGTVAVKKSQTFPEGGTLDGVRFGDPVYVLEPSGRYRATSDMSIGGGILGSISLGRATASLDVNNERAAINEIRAEIMEGQFAGDAAVGLSKSSGSSVKGAFNGLDLGGLLALGFGRVVPVEGRATGEIDMTFATRLRKPNGSITAVVAANAGTSDRGFVPVNGDLDLTATDGDFDVKRANFRTEKTTLDIKGRAEFTSLFEIFERDQHRNSDLTVEVRSTDAAEVDRIVRVTGISPEFEEQLDSLHVTVAGGLTFDGHFTGDLSYPVISGNASLDSISMRGRELGSVTTEIVSDENGSELRNGKLQERGGGNAVFSILIPASGKNNVVVRASLTNINAANLLAALPIELPERIRDLDGRATGAVDISGLPNEANGSVDLNASNGSIGSQPFDELKVTARFNGTAIDLKNADLRFGAGRLSATGNYDRATTAFGFALEGKSVPIPLVLALLPKNDSIPAITGDLDLTAKAKGNYNDTKSYLVEFSGIAPAVQVGETNIGAISLKGQTVNESLVADLTATLEGKPQVIGATVDLSNDNLPFKIETNFDQSPVAPILAFVPQLKGFGIVGTGTGRVEFGGNLSKLDDKKVRIFTTSDLSGTAQFSQLALQIQDTPLAATEPVLIRFNTSEIVFERARFAGGGSNMSISGRKALSDSATNDLSIDGRVNLTLLNLTARDTFFSGFADTSVRILGPNSKPQLSGNANIVNGSVATFIGTDRFTVDRLKARMIFTSNQVEVEEATGYLGGGKFRANGGGYLDGLSVKSFRFSLDGTNVTLPLPKDFVTTGDAQLEITGARESEKSDLQLTLSGRVFAKRSIYSKDIDLANVVGARRDTVLAGGGGSISAPRFDLIIEGRDALIVKNNIADLTASVSLVLTGDANNPRLSGRITANSGTILFRKDRYEVQRGVLEFPPDTAIEPVISLLAESEIAGYQVFVNLSGPLKDSEQLSATVRSSPALPQADVVSLITTGSLTNTAGGIPTLAQTGINTAAEILTDTIINNPARKATDKLFGLNVFEIDPIISGQQLNPSARLTVGRQINNNLRVTYSTNLSQDQKQVLALEYRVSNKLSFVAQYEQRSLSNVTRNRDNFSFEIRFRKRF